MKESFSLFCFREGDTPARIKARVERTLNQKYLKHAGRLPTPEEVYKIRRTLELEFAHLDPNEIVFGSGGCTDLTAKQLRLREQNQREIERLLHPEETDEWTAAAREVFAERMRAAKPKDQQRSAGCVVQ